jgi:hypothetical protein
MLFASIEHLVDINYQAIVYWILSMVGIFGVIYAHRTYMSEFEIYEVTKFFYAHTPFIVMVLLLMVSAFLLFGKELHDWLDIHPAVRYTMFTCVFLLALEMASLERVKHKIKIRE